MKFGRVFESEKFHDLNDEVFLNRPGWTRITHWRGVYRPRTGHSAWQSTREGAQYRDGHDDASKDVEGIGWIPRGTSHDVSGPESHRETTFDHPDHPDLEAHLHHTFHAVPNSSWHTFYVTRKDD